MLIFWSKKFQEINIDSSKRHLVYTPCLFSLDDCLSLQVSGVMASAWGAFANQKPEHGPSVLQGGQNPEIGPPDWLPWFSWKLLASSVLFPFELLDPITPFFVESNISYDSHLLAPCTFTPSTPSPRYCSKDYMYASSACICVSASRHHVQIGQ